MDYNTEKSQEKSPDCCSRKFSDDKPKSIKPVSRQYTNIVLSGGSTKSIAQIAVLQTLIDNNRLDITKLKKIIGVSAGAIIGLFLVLGYDPQYIWNFVYEKKLSELINPDILMFISKGGFDDGYRIYNMIENILYEKTKIKHISFKQLHDITGINFMVIGSCLTTKQQVVFNHINTPNLKVSIAMRITIGIPILFTAFELNGNKYIDGGVLNNYPMNLVEDEIDESIGILIMNDYKTTYEDTAQYLMSVINLCAHAYFNKYENMYSNNTILINNLPDNISIINFDISQESKLKLYDCGIKSCLKFLSDK